ncbi:MAG: hypothetical protein ABI856_14955, partial [Nitrospira sp.]
MNVFAGRLLIVLAVGVCMLPTPARAETQRVQIIRFLGVTVVRPLDVHQTPEGAVGEMLVAWEERADHH